MKVYELPELIEPEITNFQKLIFKLNQYGEFIIILLVFFLYLIFPSIKFFLLDYLDISTDNSVAIFMLSFFSLVLIIGFIGIWIRNYSIRKGPLSQYFHKKRVYSLLKSLNDEIEDVKIDQNQYIIKFKKLNHDVKIKYNQNLNYTLEFVINLSKTKQKINLLYLYFDYEKSGNVTRRTYNTNNYLIEDYNRNEPRVVPNISNIKHRLKNEWYEMFFGYLYINKDSEIILILRDMATINEEAVISASSKGNITEHPMDFFELIKEIDSNFY